MQMASSASGTGERLAVGLAVGDDRLDAERAAGPQDAQGDLAAVGDEDLPEHPVRRPCRWSTSATTELDDEQLLAVLDGVARLDEAGADDAVARGDDLLGDAQHVDRHRAGRRRARGSRPTSPCAAGRRRPPARWRHACASDRAVDGGSGCGWRCWARGGRSGPRSPERSLAARSPARRSRRTAATRRSAGRRRRTRQAPSRTSSSPSPVAPSLAMRAGRSSPVRRSMAAWSAARSARRGSRRRASCGSGSGTRLHLLPGRRSSSRDQHLDPDQASPRRDRADRAGGRPGCGPRVRATSGSGDLSVGAQRPVASVALVDERRRPGSRRAPRAGR